MKKADRSGAKYVLIVGEDELAKGSAILRNMQTKEQSEVPIDGAASMLINKLCK
jgi:histidyl-tRNA synthetase